MDIYSKRSPELERIQRWSDELLRRAKSISQDITERVRTALERRKKGERRDVNRPDPSICQLFNRRHVQRRTSMKHREA